MRLLMVIAVALTLFVPAQALASKCIEVDDKVYCEQPSTITVGGVEVTVTDPGALLDAATKSKQPLQITSALYDDFQRIPVIVELANQNGMDYDDFITFMIDNWATEESNPFALIRAFEEIYDDIDEIYRDVVITGIAHKVADDVVSAIYAAYGGETRNA